MRSWLFTLSLGLGLLSWTATAASPMAQLVRRGQHRLAARSAQRAIQHNPDDVELFAVLAVSWTRIGFNADAMGAFPLATGADYYEDQGLEAQADALHALGHAAQAAELRAQRVLDPSLSESRELRMWLEVADDLRSAGDLEGALDTVYRAMSIFPRSPQVHAVLAEVHLDAGQLELAEEALHMADSQGGTLRSNIAHARLCLAQDDLECADEWLTGAKDYRNRTRRLAALRAELLRRQGDPAGAEDLLAKPNWARSDDPLIGAARLLALIDLEDWEGAEKQAELGRRLSATDPDMAAALDRYDAQHP